ncbi:hypothetical protein SPHI_24910 [Sphingomonas jeddahensis]|uniref:Uncharacterized protein n=1 Tax=Sphingomonas jeddahensis TaxID=1915074 RepID=A0A1V2ETB0_9SPHN|nr:hypothetical protein SPHI_24910 [Sphingomonas jeddahensis]
MRQFERAAHAGGEREAGADRAAQDVLHVDRLALADERAIEEGVDGLAAGRIAVGEIEIIRADALAPFGEREAVIVAAAGGDHQRVRAAVIVAAAIGFRLGQAGGDEQAAGAIGDAAREQLAGAAVGDAHLGIGGGLAVRELGNPGEAALAAPFEMDRHVGDECGAGDIARRVAAEQRAAEDRAGKLDDVEAGLAERDADDLEILALAGQRDLHRGALPGLEDRLLAGVIDADRLAAALDLLDLGAVGLRHCAEPLRDLAVVGGDADALAADA